MRNQKKPHELIRQNELIVKKSQKHEANLQKNSTLYFQIGLIVCLLAAFGLLEMRFEKTIPVTTDVLLPDDPEEIYIENFKVYEEPKSEQQKETQNVTKLIDKIEEVDNDYETKKDFEVVTSEQDTSPETPIDPGKVNVMDKPEDDTPFDFIRIEQVPIYPGCENEKTNDGRKQCFSDKITKLIQRKFDGNDIATQYGLSGMQRIDVQFTVDKTGKVKDIKTRSPHPKLNEEAKRVINFIPQMVPGKQRDKNVGVIYNVPIKFMVQ
ncbi:energy transducer TonB [Flavobacteriaceae bacterium SZ-1-7]|uniref:energy transducer TonB n=1 Tax=Tamlana sedimenti TaxID=3134126 RepID=UPI00312846C7